MVAVILPPGRSLRSTLSYNENKVALGEKHAVFLHAANYAKDSGLLSFNDKLKRLTHLAALNPRVKAHSIHITLSFDPSEKDLPKATLLAIADKYMQGIGYAKQPYLVYQHKDSGAPHLHIVTTNVQANSIRIKSNNIGKNQSEKIRTALEQEYGLVKAQRQRELQQLQTMPINVQKVVYGKSETKRAIANVLKHVLNEYIYSSLPELNAILRQYNVMADRGSTDSRVYKNNGLVYRVLNEQGEKDGLPIKSSLIYFKPTLSYLEKKFAEKEPLKQAHKQRIKNAIDMTFASSRKTTLKSLSDQLSKSQIQVIPWQNEKGFLYGLTYIDHNRKVVWNGSDIGKGYSVAGLLRRLKETSNIQQIRSVQQQKLLETIILSKSEPQLHPTNVHIPFIHTSTIKFIETLQALLQPEYEGTLNPELRDERKKKQRRNIHHI